MIQNRVYKVKEQVKLQNGIQFPAGQEIEVVMDVVYIGGFPLPADTQATVLLWIKENSNLIIDVTKNW